MKTLIKAVAVCLLLGSLTACHKNPEEVEKNYIADKIEGLKFDDQKQWVVVLPGLGCKGCIQEGEYFMQQNINHQNVFFLLTKVESIKLLQEKIGVKIADHSNVMVDKDNYFDLPTKDVIYPLIVEVDRHKFKNYTFQSPKNSMAFEKLSEKLKGQ